MRRIGKWFVIASAAIAMASFGWWSAVSPNALRRVPLVLVKAINLPVATVEWLTHSYQGIDLWYRSAGCEWCSPFEHAVRYFGFAIPVYVFLFSVASIGWAKMKKVGTAQRGR